MRAADLAPGPRRLLRHVGRIDPNWTILQPGEFAVAAELSSLGLIEVRVQNVSAQRARVTAAGREALR